MNNHTDYRRHAHQPASEPAPEPGAAAEALQNHLAFGHDPSLGSTPAVLTTATGKHLAWVRPTELHTIANPLIARGIDLQAELTRRTRQGPRHATRAAHRLATPSLATPPLAAAAANPPHEGISL